MDDYSEKELKDKKKVDALLIGELKSKKSVAESRGKKKVLKKTKDFIEMIPWWG